MPLAHAASPSSTRQSVRQLNACDAHLMPVTDRWSFANQGLSFICIIIGGLVSMGIYLSYSIFYMTGR
jgi:hypothetical protein